MTQDILADSEDDEEDLLDDHNADGSQIAVAYAQSTGSTGTAAAAATKASLTQLERLRRQIAQAEQALVSNSAMRSATCAMNMAETPSLKRRHSQVPTEPLTATARLKRVKSARASPSFSSALISQAAFDTFSEHSQQPTSSAFVPQGSIKEGFLAHEPHVLFGQSGDTVPDNTATQQLVRDLAAEKQRRSSKVVSEPGPVEDFLIPPSSSVLLSTSQLFDTEQAASVAQIDGGEVAATLHGVGEQQPSSLNPVHQETAELPAIEESSSASIHVATKPSLRTRSKPAEEAPPSDSMSSQTALIGLPAEKYVPRPTKRRATQIPQNFNLEPEKITRTKRSKTTNASLTAKNVQQKSSAKTSKTEVVDKPDDGSKADAILISDGDDNRQIDGVTTDHDTPNVAPPVQSASTGLPTDDSHTQDELAPTQTTTGSTEQATVVPKDIFVKPAISKRGKKAAKKSKRSHTTIFEDHVDLALPKQSPNLSQQQAERSAALLDAENALEHKKSQRGKSKHPDNDLDELALDFGSSRKEDLVKQAVKSSRRSGSPCKLPEISDSSSSPGKKDSHRGRQENAAPPAEVPDDATEPVGEAGSGTGRALTPEATPRPKITPAGQTIHPLTDAKAERPNQLELEPPKITPAGQTIHPRTDAKAERPSQTELEPPKSSPTTHSPIRTTSGPSMRVGLSKRQRIPSLLKLVRPAKK